MLPISYLSARRSALLCTCLHVALMCAYPTSGCSASTSSDAANDVKSYVFRPEPARFLTKRGLWLHDRDGRYVILRGVNFGSRSKLPPYLPIAPLCINSTADLACEIQKAMPEFVHLRELGVNFVRLLVLWKGLEPQLSRDGNLPQAGVQYMNNLKAIADALYSQGMYILLDFHQDIASDRYGGDGFPDWALAVDGKHDRTNKKPTNKTWGLLYYSNPLPFTTNRLVRNTLRSFWTNNLTDIDCSLRNFPVRDHFVHMIGVTAEFFRGDDAILGYEPFNERHPVGIPKSTFEGEILPAFYANVFHEIARSDAKSFLFIEPRMDWTTYRAEGREFQLLHFTRYPTTLLSTGNLADAHDRLIFSFHYYDPKMLVWLFKKDMRKKATEWPATFSVMRDAAVARDLVPFLTEFGCMQNWKSRTDLLPVVYRGSVVRACIDLQYQQVERYALNSAYWNFDLYNTKGHGDNWNGEDLSLWGPDRQPRDADIVARP
jgi:hypothetical protein